MRFFNRVLLLDACIFLHRLLQSKQYFPSRGPSELSPVLQEFVRNATTFDSSARPTASTLAIHGFVPSEDPEEVPHQIESFSASFVFHSFETADFASENR